MKFWGSNLGFVFPCCSLENALRRYTCLSSGDTIMIPYNHKKLYINILETKPDPAILIIETDCEVDFAPPLDYKEPEKVNLTKFTAFTGSAYRLDGKPSAEEKSYPGKIIFGSNEKQKVFYVIKIQTFL